MMEFYTSNKVKARKVHVCEMCGGQINPGEEYQRESGKYDGEFFDRKLHLDCLSVLEEYCSNVDTEFTYEDVYEYWVETYCHSCKHFYPECKPDDECKEALAGLESEKQCEFSKNGRCTAADACSEHDRHCWCTKYEKE